MHSSTNHQKIGTLLGLASVCTAAWATGSEMAGIALAVRLFPFMAAFVLIAAVLVVYLFLPKSWPVVKRWAVAAAVGPFLIGVVVLVASGAGLLQLQLAKLLLP
jgi:hypothetical protein